MNYNIQLTTIQDLICSPDHPTTIQSISASLTKEQFEKILEIIGVVFI